MAMANPTKAHARGEQRGERHCRCTHTGTVTATTHSLPVGELIRSRGEDSNPRHCMNSSECNDCRLLVRISPTHCCATTCGYALCVCARSIRHHNNLDSHQITNTLARTLSSTSFARH